MATPPTNSTTTIEPCTHTARQLWQYSGKLALENILVRANGHLLLTSFHTGDLYSLDPSSSSPSISTLVSLPGSTGLAGITALDGTGTLFAVSGGEHISFGFVKETVAVYVVQILPDSNDQAVVLDRIFVNAVLNGMTSLPGSPHVALGVDSKAGTAVRIDTRTRQVDVAIADPALEPGSGFPLGVNGVRARGDGYLYFTNSGKGTFARVAIDAQGNKAGDVEVLASLPTMPPSKANAYDDFIFDGEGNAYVSLHSDSYVKITPDGVQTPFVNSTMHGGKIYEPTSAAISRYGKTLYLCTGGSLAGGKTVGGQVLEVTI